MVCPMCVETVAVSDVKSITPSQLQRVKEDERQDEEDKEEDEDEEEGRPFTGGSSRGSSAKLF